MSLDASQPGVRMLCSGKGCRADAAYGLLWNNPKLHAPERRKTWLTCEEHREFLSYFLSARGFLKDTVPVSQLADETDEPDGPDES
jgi:hypothetical protein